MLSVPHLIIIFLVALVVFGPEKLPELARTLGKVMGEFRRATGDLRSTFEDHLRDLEREADMRRIASPKPAPPPTSAVTTTPSAQQPTGTVPTSAPNSAERIGGTEAETPSSQTSSKTDAPAETQTKATENIAEAKSEDFHPGTPSEKLTNGGNLPA
jgi:sec-independent protein translocase protein TatB